jgi:hypothetical protein
MKLNDPDKTKIFKINKNFSKNFQSDDPNSVIKKDKSKLLNPKKQKPTKNQKSTKTSKSIISCKIKLDSDASTLDKKSDIATNSSQKDIKSENLNLMEESRKVQLPQKRNYKKAE